MQQYPLKSGTYSNYNNYPGSYQPYTTSYTSSLNYGNTNLPKYSYNPNPNSVSPAISKNIQTKEDTTNGKRKKSESSISSDSHHDSDDRGEREISISDDDSGDDVKNRGNSGNNHSDLSDDEDDDNQRANKSDLSDDSDVDVIEERRSRNRNSDSEENSYDRKGASADDDDDDEVEESIPSEKVGRVKLPNPDEEFLKQRVQVFRDITSDLNDLEKYLKKKFQYFSTETTAEHTVSDKFAKK